MAQETYPRENPICGRDIEVFGITEVRSTVLLIFLMLTSHPCPLLSYSDLCSFSTLVHLLQKVALNLVVILCIDEMS